MSRRDYGGVDGGGQKTKLIRPEDMGGRLDTGISNPKFKLIQGGSANKCPLDRFLLGAIGGTNFGTF